MWIALFPLMNPMTCDTALDEALAAHEGEFSFETPGTVKLLLPPRQSRGDSRLG